MAELKKKCRDCGLTKGLSEFGLHDDTRDGLQPTCRVCRREDNRRWYKRMRREVLAALGNECIKCGFSDERALQLDHINGGGYQDRKDKTFRKFYYEIIREERNDIQLLCANCNQIKRAKQGEHRGRT